VTRYSLRSMIGLVMVGTLAIAPPAFAQGRGAAADLDRADEANTAAVSDKAHESDGTDKAKSDKTNKADSDKADRTDKAKKAEKPATDETPAQGGAAQASGAPAAAAVQEERDDAVFDPAQPDFTLITLPTTLRLPRNKSSFRVTHRFTRALGEGSFGSLAEDFFGLDGGAQIGLEFRYGIWPGAQIGVQRTSDRTIQFFGQYDVKSQSGSFPVGIAAYASIDGTNNFKDSYSPALGAVISRTIHRHAAVYVAPIWVNNSNHEPSELVDDNDTLVVGVGARVRVHGGTYVVFELTPRASGYDPGVNGIGFGIEKRVGGHSFQLNFTNAFGTTMGQIAQGGPRNPNGDQNWYLGFNISRKFF